MQKHLLAILVAILTVIGGCSQEQKHDIIKFATCADYPPFEYLEKGKITGFDIELGHLIAKKLGKTATFDNISFASILPALQNEFADAAIAMIAITPERQNNYDFSTVYYTSTLAVISTKEQHIEKKEQLANQKVACQLGTTMEMWLKKQTVLNIQIITFDTNNQVIEALKAGHVAAALTDSLQATSFIQQNPALSCKTLNAEVSGYGIALKKGSPLTVQINKALYELQQGGEITKLQQKWLGVSSCKN